MSFNKWFFQKIIKYHEATYKEQQRQHSNYMKCMHLYNKNVGSHHHDKIIECNLCLYATQIKECFRCRYCKRYSHRTKQLCKKSKYLKTFYHVYTRSKDKDELFSKKCAKCSEKDNCFVCGKNHTILRSRMFSMVDAEIHIIRLICDECRKDLF